MRLQLSHKGNNAETYSNFGNVVVAFAFLLIPVIGWLLDKKGYGATLGTILALSVLTLVLQATPTLPLQVFTITVWMIARFFMYARYGMGMGEQGVEGERLMQQGNGQSCAVQLRLAPCNPLQSPNHLRLIFSFTSLPSPHAATLPFLGPCLGSATLADSWRWTTSSTACSASSSTR